MAKNNLTVTGPVKGLKGDMTVPGDKSISHRAVILGAVAEGTTKIDGFLWGEDNISTINACKSMNVKIKETDGALFVEGRGLDGLQEPDDVIDAGNSGTTARFFSGLLAGQRFFTVITGDSSLRKRPMRRITEPLALMGAKISGRQMSNLLPLAITGGKLEGLEYVSPLASAQVKSALLLAALYADGETTITEPIKSRDHTERMIKVFGGDIKIDALKVVVNGRPNLRGCNLVIPGDISSAAFFVVAAIITPDSELLIRGVGINPTRTGFINLLLRMGADITVIQNNGEEGNEPIADILIKSSMLHGIEISHEEIPAAIDEFPILCVAAALAEGRTTITGASELRVKESDRIAVISENLKVLGAVVHELPDGLEIDGIRRLKGGLVNSYGDHRIAMSMIVAGLAAEGETEVIDIDCVNVSFPDFSDKLKAVSQ